MRNGKILSGLFLSAIFLLVFFGATVQTNAVTISTLPFKDEGSMQGFSYTAVSEQVDTKFHALTELSKQYDMPIAAMKFERNKISVELSGTNVISEIEGVRDYINPTLANNTWDTATMVESNTSATDGVFTTPAASAKDTELAFSLTTGADVAASVSTTTITSRTGLGEDLDGDGVFQETGLGEKDHWRVVDENTMLYFNIEAIDLTADTGWVRLRFIFETTAAADYNVSVVLNTGSGDTSWSGLGSSADNEASWDFYDVVTGVTLAQMIPMDELLTDDLGDSPAIQGLDAIELTLFAEANDTTDLEISVRNLAFFPQGELVAITDNQDGDDDFDFADTNGVPVNSQDDTDLLITEVTEGATESYDSVVAIESTILSSDELTNEFRKIEFSGTATIQATDESVVTSTTEGAFLVETTFVLRTSELKDITTASRRPTWSNMLHNMTVEDDFIIDTSDPDFNFQSYDIDDVDELDSFASVWIGKDDGDEIQFDIADPSSTDGAKQDIVYSWTSPQSVTFVEAVGVAVVEEIGGIQGAINGVIEFLEGLGELGALMIGILGIVGIRKVVNSRNK